MKIEIYLWRWSEALCCLRCVLIGLISNFNALFLWLLNFHTWISVSRSPYMFIRTIRTFDLKFTEYHVQDFRSLSRELYFPDNEISSSQCQVSQFFFQLVFWPKPGQSPTMSKCHNTSLFFCSKNWNIKIKLLIL